MTLLNDEALERSSIVANMRMNRERGAVGVNSYAKDIGLDPIAFLMDRLQQTGAASWLDLCCGRGRALFHAAEYLHSRDLRDKVRLVGVDLVDMFDNAPPGITPPILEARSLHCWEASGPFDLITCVHGLHYIGDKLLLIERAVSWLSPEGTLLANLDLMNLRASDGSPLGRQIAKRFREAGMIFDGRRHLLSCVGGKSISLGYRYLGADDTAGANYSGQEAVDSYYEVIR